MSDTRTLLEKIGISFEGGEYHYPNDSEREKVGALYELIALWVRDEMVEQKSMQLTDARLFGPNEDWLKNWVEESVEEFLFG